ncbi:FAD-binding oxidoreductase [Pseudoalteromonas luteoviolacea]|uniref:FAD-binding oxidoreductase n=1 Tax=Pseudoalteromonas luteoviolacea TaxID=43657 RepID=UPI001F42A3DF|nr:FAD-binding oxidoreductase [Pseudoalteromonas luteoviolacea]MCF6441368.1 FAD-binding oxidoreductase [Pseudoalteromonas luteoviolacea]
MSRMNKAASVECQISRIAIETQSCISIYLRRVDGLPFLQFSAGQYVALELVIQGKSLRRCYTISSSSQDRSTIRLTIERVNQGLVSNWLCDHAAIGLRLDVGVPTGQFVLPSESKKKLLWMAAGSGVTPFIAMLHELADAQLSCDVVMLISVKQRQDLIGYNELEALIKLLPNVKLVTTFTSETDLSRGQLGRWTADRIADVCPDLHERLAYLCGGAAFTTDMQQALISLDVAPENVLVESFFVVNTNNAREAEPTSMHVQLMPHDVRWKTDGTQTLLALSESQGVEIPSVCRSGLCGACSVTIKGPCHSEGREALDDASFEAGARLACMTFPRGDCVVELN